MDILGNNDDITCSDMLMFVCTLINGQFTLKSRLNKGTYIVAKKRQKLFIQNIYDQPLTQTIYFFYDFSNYEMYNNIFLCCSFPAFNPIGRNFKLCSIHTKVIL